MNEWLWYYFKLKLLSSQIGKDPHAYNVRSAKLSKFPPLFSWQEAAEILSNNRKRPNPGQSGYTVKTQETPSRIIIFLSLSISSGWGAPPETNVLPGPAVEEMVASLLSCLCFLGWWALSSLWDLARARCLSWYLLLGNQGTSLLPDGGGV